MGQWLKPALVRLLSAAALGLALLAPGAVLAAPPIERFIVVLHDNVGNPSAVAADLSRRHNGRVEFVYEHALHGFSIEVPAQAAVGIARDPRVAFVERDQLVFAFQTASEVPTGVDRMEVDRKLALASTIKTVDVDIAILDTGIADHPDLSIFKKVNCSGGSPFRGTCKEGSASDGNGHGTHVAGTAAAKDDGAGVVGVAPGARLWAVKVLNDQGSGQMSWIVAGIDYVTKNATSVEVANMSLGCECTSDALNKALTSSTDAGVVFVVAAGNSAKDASTFSPANHPQVIATSAVADFDGKAGGTGAATCRADVDDTLADFSNFGPTVDIAAPGVCIRSTWNNGGYNTISGTSMASPHAAGAAALYVVENRVSQSSSRWSSVLTGLQNPGWSVPQSDSCGFTNEKSSSERMLMLALPCEIVT